MSGAVEFEIVRSNSPKMKGRHLDQQKKKLVCGLESPSFEAARAWQNHKGPGQSRGRVWIVMYLHEPEQIRSVGSVIFGPRPPKVWEYPKNPEKVYNRLLFMTNVERRNIGKKTKNEWMAEK